MGTPRSSPVKAGSDKMLWVGVALVIVIVLAMGLALMRLQAQPQEPLRVGLPALPAPPGPTTPAMASAATEAVSSAAPAPPASSPTDPRIDTAKPRIVQPDSSEPAVARAPQRAAPKPDAADNENPPAVTR